VDPDLRGNPGIFAVRDGVASVYVQHMEFPLNKPILLHEFLHAYHFRVMHLDRPEIQEEFQLVKHSNLFPARFQSSHFLANAKEFFAVTGTLYLFGDIQQPPFDCKALSRLRPQYLHFLGNQFGPPRCPGSDRSNCPRALIPALSHSERPESALMGRSNPTRSSWQGRT